MRLPARRPRYADVASTLALLLALGGTAYAATELAANSVGAAHIRAGAVGSSEVADNTVRGVEVANESLTLADIVGADVAGRLSFSLGTWDCDRLTIDVPGARAGQLAVFSFTAPADIPEGVASSAPTVSAGKVSLQFCNGDTAVDAPVEVTDAPFRVVTFS